MDYRSCTRCKRLLPPETCQKHCAQCRERANGYVQAHRARNKAQPSTQSVVGEKRVRISEEIPSRPSQRRKLDYNLEKRDENGDLVSEDENDDKPGDNYCDAEDFFDALRDAFKKGPDVDIHATYPIKKDELVSAKERVHMVARDIWQVTGYRFTVKDNKALKNAGFRTRFWCSQDEGRKKRAKSSQKDGVKHRVHVGMKRYPCQSQLIICYYEHTYTSEIRIKLQHHVKHAFYVDTAKLPEAIEKEVEDSDVVNALKAFNKRKTTVNEE